MARHGTVVRGGAAPRVLSAPEVHDDAAGPTVRPRPLQHHPPSHRLAGALVAAVMVLVGARIAQGPQPVTAPARPTRGEVAQTARLEGQAAAYEEYRARRSERADAARWTAQAAFHDRLRQATLETASPAVPSEWHLRRD